MSQNDPRVSIIIPTYNRAEVISRAVESALDQKYNNIEVIVVDDGSTDQTHEVMAKYEDDIKYTRLDENMGANAARNKGIELATGEYISFLDSDDEYPIDNIQKKVEVLRDLPDSYGGVFTPHRTYKNGRLWRSGEYDGSKVNLDDLKRKNVVGGFSCIAVRASVFEDIEFLDETLPSAQDYDFYLRLTQYYSLKYIEGTYVNRYAGDDRIGFNIYRKRRGHTQLLEKHGQLLSSSGKARQHSALGVLLARQGNSSDARSHFRNSVTAYRYEIRAYPLLLISYFGDFPLQKTVELLDWINGVLTSINSS